MEPTADGATTEGTGMDRRTLAMGAHLSVLTFFVVAFLSVLGPVLVWVLPARKDPFVVAHAQEALNFQLTLFLVALLGIAAYVVLGVLSLGIGLILLLPLLLVGAALLAIAAIVSSITAAMAANRGEMYRYPLCIRLVR